jgi:hypothetical protein
MDQTPDVERHDALLGRVAAEVSRLDGSEPGGALIGPRLLFLAAFGRLCDERLVKIGTAIELLRRATLAHREPQREAYTAATGDLRLSSTLVGDTHLAASFRLLADDGDPQTVAVLASAMATAAEGETERLIDGGGHRRRGAFAVGAVDVGISVCNLDAGEARRLRTVAAYVGEAHERGDVTARAGMPGYTGNGRRSLLVSLLEHVGKADVIAPEPGAQSL